MYKVPALIDMILKVRRIAIGYDLASVDNVVSGAAPLSEKTADALRIILPSCRIRQGYGESYTITPLIFLLTINFQVLLKQAPLYAGRPTTTYGLGQWDRFYQGLRQSSSSKMAQRYPSTASLENYL